MIRIAVLYGGMSTEHSISCISADSVMSHMPAEYEVVPIGITQEGVWVEGVANPAEGAELPVVKPGREVALSLNPQRKGLLYDVTSGETITTIDAVFPVLHGKYGEDGTVQGLLEMAGVPYVGPGVLASACGMDKEYTKKLVAAVGIPVTREVILDGARELTEAERSHLGLPVFVKPANGGSSIGVSKVTSWEALPAAVSLALESDGKVIVEAELVGDEVEVGVLERPDGTIAASVPAKLNGTEDSAEGFYGFETKYLEEGVTATIPAPYSDGLIAQLQDMAVTCFRALDCKSLARVDFFVTENGPVLNEINTMPGFTAISMYPQVWAATGVDYPQLLDTLIRTALR